MSFTVSPTIPILRIFSVAKEFYCDFLEFTIDWEHRFDAAAPIYMQISRAGLTLGPMMQLLHLVACVRW